MAKKHKNLDNIPIQWDGDLSKPADGSAQSSPDRVDIVWGGEYTPCWYPNNHADCVIEDMYFEDFDIIENDILNAHDVVGWIAAGRYDIANYILTEFVLTELQPDKAPSSLRKTYTWGDVSFIIEIADGIGTGSRRAREARLHKFDKDTKKRLIHLICRVKGEKVYDEEKEVGDIQIKLEDADLVIERVLGKMRVENANVL